MGPRVRQTELAVQAERQPQWRRRPHGRQQKPQRWASTSLPLLVLLCLLLLVGGTAAARLRGGDARVTAAAAAAAARADGESAWVARCVQIVVADMRRGIDDEDGDGIYAPEHQEERLAASVLRLCARLAASDSDNDGEDGGGLPPAAAAFSFPPRAGWRRALQEAEAAPKAEAAFADFQK